MVFLIPDHVFAGGDPSAFARELSTEFHCPVAMAADDDKPIRPFKLDMSVPHPWNRALALSGLEGGDSLGPVFHARLDLTAFEGTSSFQGGLAIPAPRPFNPQSPKSDAVEDGRVSLVSEDGKAFRIDQICRMQWDKPVTSDWCFQKLGVRLSFQKVEPGKALALIASAIGATLKTEEGEYRFVLDPKEQHRRMLGSFVAEGSRLGQPSKNPERPVQRARIGIALAMVPNLDDSQLLTLWAAPDRHLLVTPRRDLEKRRVAGMYDTLSNWAEYNARKEGVGSAGAVYYGLLQDCAPEKGIDVDFSTPIATGILVLRRAGGSALF